jgi:ABC-type antimicrobial peptide transport system permease subunit
MQLRFLIAAAAVVGIAVLAGFVAGFGVIWLTNALLPPFREEVDDDTMREFAPVALAYLTWAVTTVAVLLFALRRQPR